MGTWRFSPITFLIQLDFSVSVTGIEDTFWHMWHHLDAVTWHMSWRAMTIGENTVVLLYVYHDIFRSICDTAMRLVLFLTFSRSRNSKMLKLFTWPFAFCIIDMFIQSSHCNVHCSFIVTFCLSFMLSLHSILQLSRSGISNKPKWITWPWRLTLKIKVKHTPTWPLLSLSVYMLQARSWCRFQHSRGRGFQINQNKSLDLDVWPWKLRSNIYLYDFQGQPSRSRDLFWFIWNPLPRQCWNRH